MTALLILGSLALIIYAMFKLGWGKSSTNELEDNIKKYTKRKCYIFRGFTKSD